MISGHFQLGRPSMGRIGPTHRLCAPRSRNCSRPHHPTASASEPISARSVLWSRINLRQIACRVPGSSKSGRGAIPKGSDPQRRCWLGYSDKRRPINVDDQQPGRIPSRRYFLSRKSRWARGNEAEGQGKKKSVNGQPAAAGNLTSRRGRPDRAFVGRARTRVARTSYHRPGKLRRCGTRGSRHANAAAGGSLRSPGCWPRPASKQRQLATSTM